LQPWIQLTVKVEKLLETALGRMGQIRMQQQPKDEDMVLEPEVGFEKWILDRLGPGRAITRLSALMDSSIAPATLKENKDWFWAALHEPCQAANILINNNIHALLSWAPASPAQAGRLLAALDGVWERKHDLTVKLLVRYTTPHALARAEDIMDTWNSPALKPRSAAHVSEILFLTDTVRVLRDDGKGYKIEEEHIAIVTLSPGTSEETPKLGKITWGDGSPERDLPEGFIVEGITTDVLRCKALWQTQSDLDIEDELIRAPVHKPMKHWARLWISYPGSAWEIFAKQHQLKSDIMQEHLQVTIGHTSQIRSKDSLVATVAGNTLWRYNPHTSGLLWISNTTALMETAHPPETWSHILTEDAEREDKICAIRWKRSQEGGKMWCRPNTLTAHDRLKLGAKAADDQSGAAPALLDIWLPVGGGLRQPQAEAQLLEMLDKITGTQWASAAHMGDVPHRILARTNERGNWSGRFSALFASPQELQRAVQGLDRISIADGFGLHRIALSVPKAGGAGHGRQGNGAGQGPSAAPAR
jgi:hypothetical protein